MFTDFDESPIKIAQSTCLYTDENGDVFQIFIRAKTIGEIRDFIKNSLKPGLVNIDKDIDSSKELEQLVYLQDHTILDEEILTEGIQLYRLPISDVDKELKRRRIVNSKSKKKKRARKKAASVERPYSEAKRIELPSRNQVLFPGNGWLTVYNVKSIHIALYSVNPGKFLIEVQQASCRISDSTFITYSARGEARPNKAYSQCFTATSNSTWYVKITGLQAPNHGIIKIGYNNC